MSGLETYDAYVRSLDAKNFGRRLELLRLLTVPFHL